MKVRKGLTSAGTLFAFEVHVEQAFPYVLGLRKAHPGKRAVITEDNYGVHLKARRLSKPLTQELGIEFC